MYICLIRYFNLLHPFQEVSRNSGKMVTFEVLLATERPQMREVLRKGNCLAKQLDSHDTESYGIALKTEMSRRGLSLDI